MNENIKQLLNNIELPVDQFVDQDAEIIEIFIEEVQEILEFLETSVPEWIAYPEDKSLLTDIRRSFHTLKGSGRMVQAKQSGELAWSVEELLNRVISESIELNANIQYFVYSVAIFYIVLVKDFELLQPHTADIRPWILVGQLLRDQQEIPEDLKYVINYYKEQQIITSPVVNDVIADEPIENILLEKQDGGRLILEDNNPQPFTSNDNSVEKLAENQEGDSVDPMMEVFFEECTEHLATVQQFILMEQQPTAESFNQLLRAIHTIRGSSGMIQQQELFEASSQIEHLLRATDVEQWSTLPHEQHVLLSYCEYVTASLFALQHHETDKIQPLYQEFAKVMEEHSPDISETLTKGTVASLLELGIEDLLDAESNFVERMKVDPKHYLSILINQAERVIASENSGKTDEIKKLVQQYKYCYQQFLNYPQAQSNITALQHMQDVHRHLLNCFDDMASGHTLQVDSTINQELKDIIVEIETVRIPSIPKQEQEVTDIPTVHQEENNIKEEPLDVDTDILNIFLEESEELIENMDEDISIWERDLQNTTVLKNLFRYLHTLKGGANMVQATQLGLLAHELETVYERIISGALVPTPEMVRGIRFVQDDIAVRIQRLKDEHIDSNSEQMIAHLKAVISGDSIAKTENIVSQVQSEQIVEPTQDVLAEESNTYIEDKNDSDKDEEIIIPALQQQNYVDTQLQEKSEKEQEGLYIPEIQENTEETTTTTNDVIQTVDDDTQSIVTQHIEHVDSTEDVETLLPTSIDDKPISTLVNKKLSDNVEPELWTIFIEESEEIIEKLSSETQLWKENIDNTSVLHNIIRHLNTLKGGAGIVGAKQLGAKTTIVESVYEAITHDKLSVTPAVVNKLSHANELLSQHVEQLAEHAIDVDNDDITNLLKDLLEQSKLSHDDSLDTSSPVSADTKVNQQDSIESNKKIINPLLVKALETGDEQQISTVVTYLEESAENLIDGEVLFNKWIVQRDNRSLLLNLQRNYHTLKGNARLVGQKEVADIAYQLEYIFEQYASKKFTSKRYDSLIRQTQAWLQRAVNEGKCEDTEILKQHLQSVHFEELLVEDDNNIYGNAEGISFDKFAEVSVVQGDGSTPPSMFVENYEEKQRSQEVIRVSADLIETMIDLSGENAINRSRIELDLGQMSNTLSEMELAIHRLVEQLRRMDSELEEQILTKHESENAQYENFDPLEMDQYSALNQLSKALAESASDLIDFKETIFDKIRDTENLLLQQSRLQNELQQNLMGTRLVPFSQSLSRLQRLVRQVSTQLNRPVEFIVDNAEIELDRNILDRLVAPFEHMLRNAIDHGIEDTATRTSLGKPKSGTIKLSIATEGHDILVRFSDDGKGIDVEAVRTKALKNGLITSATNITDNELMQYIFHSGLSTAQKVTQISGRGVGLDVVQNDIKALGGLVTVSSVKGQGTTFTIRVPTTVTVSDALMAKVGEQQFALPLAQIEQIIRLSPAELQKYYQSQDEEIYIGDDSYRLRYLGEFVQNRVQPSFNSSGLSVPVIIYNNGGYSVALQVDQLVGSRTQIVTKPMDSQMASVDYLSGATILADGRVCLILDGASIARRILTTSRVQQRDHILSANDAANMLRQTIMVVDDSVTVRKVTSRFLERQGYTVITAKDGIDAVEQLAQAKPDLMLLDIEMPRMDGFEVLNFIRHDSVHKDLPVIMITSRTGEKHREHAVSLGVNKYMGKPFQESELLTNIQDLIGHVSI